MSRFLRYFLFSFAFITFGLLVGFRLENAFSSKVRGNIDKGLKKFEQALMFVQENYVKEPEQVKLVDDAIKGMMDGLDPHSFYISASEMSRMDEQMTGSFEGIGVEYNILDDTIYVVTPLSGGPAEKVGILAGDKIVKVDGMSVVGAKVTNSDVTRFLKGEKGSKVQVSVKRVGIGRLLEFTLVRDKIPIHSVNYSYMMNADNGYIQVTRFSETTYEEFSEHLKKLKAQGMKNLVLDLRNNPGGYLMMAHRIADEFLANGKVTVTTEGRIEDSKQKYLATSQLAEFEKGGLVVLIDYSSASASEIVAGAVQDHDRGLIVGVRSYGKGLVQVQKKFDDGSAMRIVISEYYTPSGRCIQKPYNTKSHAEYENEIEERFKSGEIYDPSKIKFPDSLKFRTDAGRLVYGGGGIFPDVFVPDDTAHNSKYFTELSISDVFRRFAYDYVDHNPNIIKEYASVGRFLYSFEPNAELMRKFVMFADAKGVKFKEKDYEKSLPLLKNRVKAFLGKRLFQDDGFIPVVHEMDDVVQKAIDLIPAAKELARTGKFASAK